MIPRISILALLVVATPVLSQTTQPVATATVNVWPDGKMPGDGASKPEGPVERGDGNIRITNVSTPTLTLYAAPGKEAAPAIVVCPGGAYSYVVMSKEGSEIAAWLNANGISAVVLKYRCPNNRAGALQDIQRSLSLVRAKSKEWRIDPNRLGVIGFSAGGNLAAKASNQFDQRTYEPIDAVDEQGCRPDFAILVYPAYLGKDNKVAPDLNLKAKIPPTLIIHSEDDKNHVAGSKLYAAALTEAKHPHEFKNYPTGGHGYGLRCTKDAKAWPDDALAWLKTIEMR